jgi:hypothetical protein
MLLDQDIFPLRGESLVLFPAKDQRESISETDSL